MSAAETSIKNNLEQVFKLPPDAVSFLLDLYAVIQLFDDIADGDDVDRSDLDRVIWSTLVGFHHNPFFVRNSVGLSAVLGLQILKWQASDKVERTGNHDERSFMWRAGYYEVVLHVVGLCHGYKVASDVGPDVLCLYGENLKTYMEEFNNA